MGTPSEAVRAALAEGEVVEDEEKNAAAEAAFLEHYEGDPDPEPRLEARRAEQDAAGGDDEGEGDEAPAAGEKDAGDGGDGGEQPGDTTTDGSGGEPDPWEGVNPALRAEFDRLSTFEKEAKRDLGQLRTLQGDFHRLERQLQETRTAGGQARQPTPEQIREAADDTAKYEAMKAEFPDWAEATEQFVRMAVREVEGKIPNVDPDAIRAGVLSEVTTLMEARDVQRAHPDWRTTTKSEGFLAWANDGGPTQVETAKLAELDESDPDGAKVYLAELVTQYPQWWSERGKLLRGDTAEDVIALLDAYKQSQSPGDDPPGDPEGGDAGDGTAKPALSATAGRQSPRPSPRVARAAPPTKGRGQPAPTGKTAEQAFIERYEAED